AKKKADAADAAKKTAADKQRKQDLADELDGEKRRADEMRRVTGGVTGSGGAGTAPKSQGGRADSGYVNRVGAKIKSNTIFNTPDSLDNNPSVEYEVSLLPDGSIRGIRKLKSSNVSGFDDAVQRAINKSAPFPPDQTGIAPTSFTLIHRPKDQ
ncbi:MAG: TonB C-terminal domain-containing protein, partial [Herminiimonas sp.]|nr:TonB C-terminal domain-containing protein [Herminiimonas sp.]